MKTTLPILLGLALAVPSSLRSQPAGAGAGGGIDIQASTGVSFNGEVSDGHGRRFDDVRVTQFGLQIGQSFALQAGTNASLALGYDRFDFSGVFVLPDAVQSWTLDAGIRHRIDDNWMFLGGVAPGFNNAGDDLDADGFGVTVRAIALYRRSPTLTWSFGAVYRSLAESGYRALPVLGFDWRPNPAWSVALGFPRSGVTWHASRQFRLSLAASAQGGTFHVADRPWTISSLAPLTNTKLEYREIRVGLRAEFEPQPGTELFASAGMVVAQQFDFFDRNYELKDQGVAPYVSAGVKFAF